MVSIGSFIHGFTGATLFFLDIACRTLLDGTRWVFHWGFETRTKRVLYWMYVIAIILCRQSSPRTGNRGHSVATIRVRYDSTLSEHVLRLPYSAKGTNTRNIPLAIRKRWIDSSSLDNQLRLDVLQTKNGFYEANFRRETPEWDWQDEKGRISLIPFFYRLGSWRENIEKLIAKSTAVPCLA